MRRRPRCFRGLYELFPRILAAGIAWALTAAFGAGALLAAPSVSNVRASQQPGGTGRVDVQYDLSGGQAPMTVSILFSSDNGASWKVTPSPEHLSGSVGTGIANGANKRIMWNAGVDKPGVNWSQARAKVVAAESGGGPEITVSLPGNVPLVLVHIPAGSFQMGSPDTVRSHWDDEAPVHTVNIGYSFYMGKYEVTQRQWLAVMGRNPSYFQAPCYSQDLDRPVEMVSWDDISDPANGFLKKLNDHVASTGQGPAAFHLPSESEWEYACRAGTRTRFFFGDSLSADDYGTDGPAGTLPGNRSDYMWFWFNCRGDANGTYGTKPVGTKLPNQFGLYDMSGNVWEWCQDWWHDSYNYPGRPDNGAAWETQQSASYPYRVLRGGHWSHNATFSRSAARNVFPAPTSQAYRTNTLGFRLVRAK